MTNEEGYKTPEERNKAYAKFCSKHICDDTCPCYKGGVACRFLWLALETKEDEEGDPIGCPFCGCPETATFETNGRQAVQCMACTATVFADTKADAIAAWNRRVK